MWDSQNNLYNSSTVPCNSWESFFYGKSHGIDRQCCSTSVQHDRPHVPNAHRSYSTVCPSFATAMFVQQIHFTPVSPATSSPWVPHDTTFCESPSSHNCSSRQTLLVAMFVWQWCTEGGVWGVQTPPPPKFWRPSKIVPNSTRLWKLLKKIAEFRTPTHQDVGKKGSKIRKLPRFAVVLY